VRFKTPFLLAPADEDAAEREEGFVDVRAAFVAARGGGSNAARRGRETRKRN